jgi:hypothetical protein
VDCANAQALLSRQLDGTLGPAIAAKVEDHLARCTACRSLHEAFEDEQGMLREVWAPVTAPADFASRVAARATERGAPDSETRRRGTESGRAGERGSGRVGEWVVPGSSVRRWVAAAAALVVVLLAGSAIVQPTAWAGLGLLLRQVILSESPPPTELVKTPPLARVSLEQAQQAVPWRIRQPARLPTGYRLVAVYAQEIHAFAVGPTIVLHFQQGEGPSARHLGIVELQPSARVPEPVEPGAAREIAVGTGTGLLIEGRWVERESQRVWERGTMLRLVVEQDGLVIQLEADPRDGWDAERLAEVAASLR